MKSETHPEIDNVTLEQATALMWLIVCSGSRECKCHVVEQCIKCRTIEKAEAAFPKLFNEYLKANLYNTLLKAEEQTK